MRVPETAAESPPCSHWKTWNGMGARRRNADDGIAIAALEVRKGLVPARRLADRRGRLQQGDEIIRAPCCRSRARTSSTTSTELAVSVASAAGRR